MSDIMLVTVCDLLTGIYSSKQTQRKAEGGKSPIKIETRVKMV